jgi:trimeric autotransporter adhesin
MARVRLVWVWLIALMVAVMAGCGGDDSDPGQPSDAGRDTRTDTPALDVRTDTDVRSDASDAPTTDMRVDGPLPPVDAPRVDADAPPMPPMDVRQDPTVDVRQDPPTPPPADADATTPPPPDADVSTPPPPDADGGGCTNDNQCPANQPHCNTTTGRCVSPASVQVTPNNPSIALGTQQQFQATITYSDTSTGSGTAQVTWSSSVTTVATIVAGGNATSVGLGSTVITATLGTLSGTTTLTVTNATLSTITVTPANPTNALGTTRQFAATGNFSDNTTQDLTNQVTWASATTSVATINSAGLAQTAGVGDSVISATSGTIVGSTTLHVTNAVLTSIAVTPPTPTIPRFTSRPMFATGTYSDNTTQDLTTQVNWSSSNVGVATVSTSAGSQGLVTGTGAGTATITAALGTITGSTDVTVTGASLVSISISPTTPSVARGIVVPFTATGTYSDTSTFNITTLVTWTSSTVATAVISNTPGSQGVASTVNAGTTDITATLNGVTATTTLTVTAATLVSIGIQPTTPSIAKGTSQQFTAIGTYTDTSTQNITTQVTWGSSNAAVGPISNAVGSKGLANGSTPGVTNISATLGGISAPLTTLTVTNETLVSIGVTPANTSLARGLDRQFTAIGTYTDNSTQNLTDAVTWNSSNTNFATISNSAGTRGLAHAANVGAVTITATLGTVSGVTNFTVTTATLVSIQLTPPTPSIPKGTTQQFTATGTYTDSTTENLTEQASWSSNNGAVATVSGAAGSRGRATGNGTGSALISASFGGVAGSTTLTVTAATLVSIAVTPVNQTIAAGTTRQFQATGTYSDSSTLQITNLVSWATTNNAVATISSGGGTEGLATGVAVGEVDVTATMAASPNPIVGTTHLTVIERQLVSLQVDPTNPTIPQGTTQQFTATGTYTAGLPQDLTTQVSWSSSASNIATISNAQNSEGLATAAAAGATTITATFNGVSGTTLLTVNTAALVSIAVTPGNQSVANGTQIQYTAIGTYTDLSTVDLTDDVLWGSGANASISSATGSEGLATATSVGGPFNITATLGTVVGSTPLTVTAATLTSIAIAPPNPSIARGTTQQFTATGTYSDMSTQPITAQVSWGSSNSAVAAISNGSGSEGLATGVTPGTGVTITASLNGITGTATISVTAATLTSITVTPASGAINPGDLRQYTATGNYSDATTQNITDLVTWNSTVPATATISNAQGSRGLATGVAAGTTSITATMPSTTITGSASLTVN